MEHRKSFLGTGWSFPPEFRKQTQSVKMISDEEDIKSSLEILLTTRLTERVMFPEYGCNLEELLFENLNRTLITYVSELIRTAILYHEPRIDVDRIDITDTNQEEGRLDIKVSYTVRATNSRNNVVFPFYLEEGTDIQQ